MIIICAVVSGYDIPKSSHFPIADLFISMKPEKVILGHKEMKKKSIRIHFEDMFAGIEQGNNREILRRADDKIALGAKAVVAPDFSCSYVDTLMYEIISSRQI